MANCKRKSIALDVKYAVIKKLEDGVKPKTICKEFDLKANTVSNISRNKEKIKRSVENGGFSSKRKRIRLSEFDDVEKALLLWYQNVSKESNLTSRALLREKALCFAELFHIRNFTASNGWYQRFKDRNISDLDDIFNSKLEFNEFNFCNSSLMMNHGILENYQPYDIYTINETSLYYKLVNTEFYDKLTNVNGKINKRNQEKITIAIGSNMNKSSILPMALIGNADIPENVLKDHHLPIYYFQNNRSIMFSSTWEMYLRKLDLEMTKYGRKILILTKNCCAHPKIADLKSIEIKYAPSNNKFQPFSSNQLISKIIKSIYRKFAVDVVAERLEIEQYKTINIFDTIFLLKEVYNQLSAKLTSLSYDIVGNEIEDILNNYYSMLNRMDENSERLQLNSLDFEKIINDEEKELTNDSMNDIEIVEYLLTKKQAEYREI